MFHRSNLTSFSLLLFSSALQAAPAFHLQMTQAQENYTAKDYLYQQVTAAMRYSKIISHSSVINLNADLYHRRYPDISSWDSDGLLLEFIYNLVPTAGFREPMYSILLRHEASDSSYQIADFARSTLILADQFRLDDRQSLNFGIELVKRNQGQYDADLLGLFAATNVSLTDQWLLYLNLKLQHSNGDIALGSAYTDNADTRRLRLYLNESSGDIRNIFITLGTNYSINAHHSFDLSYQSIKYDINVNDSSYNLVSLDYFYRF